MALLGIISCCMGFSLLVESRGSSLVAELGFFITVASLVEHGLEGARASVVVAQATSTDSSACGIFPDQGSNPCPLHWQVDS